MLVKPVLLGAAGNLAYACHSAAGNYDAVCPGNPSAPGTAGTALVTDPGN